MRIWRQLSSVAVRADGPVEERLGVALDNGRTDTAIAVRDATAAPGFHPSSPFPGRLEPERVRVNEYRSLITVRSSYRVAGSGEP